jgi:hypothetical protein
MNRISLRGISFFKFPVCESAPAGQAHPCAGIGAQGWGVFNDRALAVACGSGSDARCCRGAGLLTAAAGLRGTFGSFANQFHGHEASDKLLQTYAIEIDGRAFGIGFRDNSKSVLLVLDALPFGKYLHYCLLMLPPGSKRIPELLLSLADSERIW